MLALRTVFSVSVESINVGNITLDLPAFDFNANTVTNKLANCQSPPPGTPSDQIYAELIHMHGSLDAILSYELLDGDFGGVIDNWTMWNMFDECYAFLPGVGTLGTVPSSSTDSVLTARPVTTCTTDGKATIGAAVQSLDRGEKAAIGVGKSFSCWNLLAWAVPGDTYPHVNRLLLRIYADVRLLSCRNFHRSFPYRSSRLLGRSCKSAP